MNVNAPPRRPTGPPPAERQGQPWWMWLLAVLAVILLGTIGFLGAQIIGGLTPDGTPDPSAETFAMPDWTGDPITQVRTEAEDLNLVLDEEQEFSDDVERGRVISTDPASGEEVAEGSTVLVVVSRGAEEVEVPRLVGQTREEARNTLTEAGLTLGNVTEETSAQTAGTVLRSNPAEGVTVRRGSQVDIVISLGPTPSPSPSPTPEPTQPPTPLPTEVPTEVPSASPTPLL